MRALLCGAMFGLLLLPPGAPEAVSQVFPPPSAEEPVRYPPPLPPRRGPAPPPVRFVLLQELPVRGPIGPGPIRLEPDGIHVPLREGEAIVPVPFALEASPEEETPGPNPSEPGEWVYGCAGRCRFRTLPTGGVESEKRCGRCRAGWRRSWRLRVGAATPSPPLLLGSRLCFGALDNLVSCLRASNGHRLWTADVGERVSNPLASWTGPFPGTSQEGPDPNRPGLELLLVVPDSGKALLALDAYDGSQAAVHSVPESRGRLLGPALVTRGGRVVVARQGYEDTDSSIEILGLVPAEQEPPLAGGGPYNEGPRHRVERRPRS